MFTYGLKKKMAFSWIQQTPLHFACLSGHLPINSEAKDYEPNTPLYNAYCNHHLPIDQSY